MKALSICYATLGLLCLTAVSLPAQDLPTPELVEIYRDGAVITYQLDLPAGSHRIGVSSQGQWQVSDVHSWSLREEELLLPAPEMPDALLPLLLQRNALRDQALLLHRHQQSEEQIALTWTRQAFDRMLGKDPQQWRALIARWDAARDRHQLLHEALWASHRAMEQALLEALPLFIAAGANPDPLDPQAGLRVLLDLNLDPLALAEQERLDRKGLADNWARRFPEQRRRQHTLIIGLQQAQRVQLTHRLDAALTWQPALRLRLQGDQARLQEEALIQGLRHIPIGSRVHLMQSFRSRGLDAPEIPRLEAGLQPAPSAERREVITRNQSVQWTPSSSHSATITRHDLGNWQEYEGENRRMVLPDGVHPAQVLQDRWLLLPPSHRLARRQVILRLGQSIEAGRMEIERDGIPLGSASVPAVASGGEFALFLERDESLFVSKVEAWPEDPQRSAVRRREGLSLRIHNLGDSPRQVDILLTMPVSEHELVSVIASEDNSPGGKAEQPGLWCYSLQMPAHSQQGLEHGWIVSTSGDAVLPP